MRIALLFALGILLSPALALAGSDPDAAISELSKLNRVGGRRVGYGIDVSAFAKLYDRLLPHADEALIVRLRRHERPVVRAMGLTLLVRRHPGIAVDMLTDAVRDPGVVWFRPVGCIVRGSSVGGVARYLLETPWFVDWRVPNEPLVDAAKRHAIDFRIVDRNRTAALHRQAVGRVRWAIRDGEFTLDLPTLRRLYPARSDLFLVRAVGRLVTWRPGWTGAEEVTQFLAAAAADGMAADAVRLAALSGLARRTDDVVRKVIGAHRGFLRKAGQDALIHTWIARSRLLKDPAFRDNLLTSPVIGNGDPMGLTILRDRLWFYGRGGRPLPPSVVRYLRILVGRAEAGLPIWSTHAALAWELRDLFVRYRPLLEASFGPEEYGTLLARIRRATAIS